MPFLLLLVLTLVCLQTRWPNPFDLGFVGSSLLTWGGIGVLLLTAEVLTRRLCHRVRNSNGRGSVYRHLSSTRRYFVYALLAFYGLALYAFGWGYTGCNLFGKPEEAVPGRELIMLAPVFTALVFSWSRFYAVERLAHEADAGPGSFLNRWAYVALQARHNLLLVLPPLFLLLVQQTILSLFPEFQGNAYFTSSLAAVLLLTIFLGIPWILRLILGLKPLPDGPLRQRLLDTAARLRFRCNNILLWNTRGTVANAMVTGPMPFLRYVVLTDRLVEALEPEEVEAVFGHEMGHVKHHHMGFYLLFILASLLELGAIRAGLEPVTQQFQTSIVAGLADFEALALVGVLAAYVVLVFGYISRRCERQADIFGCRTVSCDAFMNALEKVADLNGIDRENPGWVSSWQHSTIALRVGFIQEMKDDQALERRFQRRIALLKWGVAAILAVALWATFQIVEPDKVWTFLQ